MNKTVQWIQYSALHWMRNDAQILCLQQRLLEQYWCLQKKCHTHTHTPQKPKQSKKKTPHLPFTNEFLNISRKIKCAVHFKKCIFLLLVVCRYFYVKTLTFNKGTKLIAVFKNTFESIRSRKKSVTNITLNIYHQYSNVHFKWRLFQSHSKS